MPGLTGQRTPKRRGKTPEIDTKELSIERYDVRFG